MPKLKTRKAAAKRYRVTGAGAVKAGHKGKRHNFSNKSRKRKRHLRGAFLLGPTDAPKAKQMMPYA